MKKGKYYWNSGMFIYKLAFFKEFFKKYAPYYSRQYEKLEKAIGQPGQFAKIYKAINPGIDRLCPDGKMQGSGHVQGRILLERRRIMVVGL